jgi:transposase
MPAGRPTDLTPEVIEDVRRILPTVMYLESVADYLGISRETIRQWCKRGRKEQKRLRNPKAKQRPKEAIYLQFIGVYKKALAEGEIHDAGVIKKASLDQWQAAAWRLERRFPGHWGRKDKAVNDDQLNQSITEILAKLAAGGAAQAADPTRTGITGQPDQSTPTP